MNVKAKLVAAGFAVLFMSGNAFAADPTPDAGAKMRGDYTSPRASRSMNRGPSYYRTAPTYDAQRSYSYQPSQLGSGSACPEPRSESVAQSAPARRSYSYVPSDGTSYGSRSWSSGGYSRSRTPSYLLQKSDPRRYDIGR